MARLRPASKKQIKEIEDSIFEEVETFLRLKAELDAVSTGNHARDSVRPEVRKPAMAWETFLRRRKAANFVEIVYSSQN